MNFLNYMKDNRLSLLTRLAACLFFSLLLSLFGASELLLLWLRYAVFLLLTILPDYRGKKRRIQTLRSALDSLNRKYLLAEIIGRPENELEKSYFYMLRAALKDMTDETADARREIPLKQCVMEALAQNKQFFIQSGVLVHTDSVTDSVYSDPEWLGFILNQILSNSVKYRSDRPPVIQIESQNIHRPMISLIIPTSIYHESHYASPAKI